ncbi:MAG: class I SAM-dependent methyltransferase [Bacteroidetes bacterium]|nr:MAG: class I SAM-dependent methyltransferase [Bacteroidota bacterium]
MDLNKCRICGNSENNHTFEAEEKMFGTREKFLYFECFKCKCIQIAEIPDDLSKFYPKDYFSLNLPKTNFVKRFIKKKWYQHSAGKENVIGKIINKRKGFAPFYEWLKYTNVNFNSSILDVGSGQGLRLYELELAGFRNLTGVDPNIDKDSKIGKNIIIYKKYLGELVGIYDLIMLHFSFEHMPNPKEIMDEAFMLLNKDGALLIRIPVTGSFAWEKYGTDWVQLDAPRHIFIHSEKSIEILAERTGFQIENVVYDSTDFQFWGSILYQNNIPLTATKMFSPDPMSDFRDLITKDDMIKFSEDAKKLNLENRGDQASFYFKKKNQK